jgi:D-alanine-D-alanine ligase
VPDIAVIFGGPSPEHDVSVLTGLQAAHELQRAGRSVQALYWSKTAEWFAVDAALEATAFVDGVPKGAQPLRLVLGADGGFEGTGGRFSKQKATAFAAAVVCCHGGPGEDGTLQAALDGAGVAYTGPSVAAAALGMDKLAFAGVMVAAGLPTLPRLALTATTGEVGFAGPYIVKPRFGGSSIGIDVVEDLATAKARLSANVHLRDGAVLEPFRPDLFDVQVALRCWPETQVSAIERPLRSTGRGGEILGYIDKYVGGEGMASAPRELPADLPAATAEELRRVALRIGDLALVRGVARIDFLTDGTELVVNEINTIPGSLARYLWIDPVVPFATLLTDMIAEATARPTGRYSAAGADGLVLRGASSIAAKLAVDVAARRRPGGARHYGSPAPTRMWRASSS